jgi:hypothetical protein
MVAVALTCAAVMWAPTLAVRPVQPSSTTHPAQGATLSGDVESMLSLVALWLQAEGTADGALLTAASTSIERLAVQIDSRLPTHVAHSSPPLGRVEAAGYVRAALTYLRSGIAAGDETAILRARELLLLAAPPAG